MSVHSLILVDDSLLEIDHIFICLAAPPNQYLLRELGLVCSDRLVRHPHQGTISSLIFFENIYLELIWVENETAAEIYAMRSGIDFLARSYWQQTNVSPFGIALRQKPEIEIRNLEVGNDSERRIHNNEFLNFAADNLAAQTEPLCFIIPDSISLRTIFDPTSETHRQLTSHPRGLRTLTKTLVATEQTSNLSAPVSMLLRDGVIQIEQNASPRLELTFDYGNRGGSLDLRLVGIPAILKY